MQLEDYITVIGPYTVRVTGHRMGIETILFDYLEEGMSAEEIAWRYPTLSREEVHAVLAYYWRNKAEVDQYLQASSGTGGTAMGRAGTQSFARYAET